MRSDLLEFLRAREEAFEFNGHVLIARELSTASQLGDMEQGDTFLRMMVACLFVGVECEEGEPGALMVGDKHYKRGEPALSLLDLPTLRDSSRAKITPLIFAVRRVNGMVPEAEEKKSDGPS